MEAWHRRRDMCGTRSSSSSAAGAAAGSTASVSTGPLARGYASQSVHRVSCRRRPDRRRGARTCQCYVRCCAPASCSTTAHSQLPVSHIRQSRAVSCRNHFSPQSLPHMCIAVYQDVQPGSRSDGDGRLRSQAAQWPVTCSQTPRLDPDRPMSHGWKSIPGWSWLA